MNAEAAALHSNALGKDLPTAGSGALEDIVDTRDPFQQAKVDAMLADPSKLEGKSELELLEMMGMGEVDRSQSDAPAGDATVHDLARAEAAAAEAPKPAEAAAAPKPADTPAPAAAAPAAAVDTPAPAAQKPVVLARNGRDVIDYAVLEAERRNAKTQRDRADAAEAALAALKAGTSLGVPAPAAAAAVEQPQVEETIDIDPSVVTLYSDDEKAEILRDYPEKVANRMIADNATAYTAFHAAIQALNGRHQDALRTKEQNVSDFIDAHPVASLWFSDPANAELMDAAIAQDNALKSSAQWKDPNLWRARFEKAIENTCKIHGVEYVRGGGGNVETPAPKAAAPQLSLAERANAALAAAAAAPRLPTSHSDLPGGAPAGASEAENVATMSPTSFLAKLEAMSPLQQEKYLATLA